MFIVTLLMLLLGDKMSVLRNVVLPILFFIGTTAGSHLVFFHNFGTKSHLIQMTPLIQELLDRNHTVTALIYQPIHVNHPNYKEVLLHNTSFFIDELQLEQSQKLLNGASVLSPSFWMWYMDKVNGGLEIMAEEIFTNELVQSPEKARVDAIVCHHSLACGPLAEVFNCPMIIFNPGGVMGYNLQGTGFIPNYSIQPFSVSPFIEPLAFIQRLQNHLFHRTFEFMIHWISERYEQHQNKYLGRQLRPLNEILKDKVSIVLACSHFTTHGATPYLPNIIEVGGLQVQKAKQLPTDLKTFMDSANAGVVFVSFGSTISSHKMPGDKLAMFIECFRRLEQEGMMVIWKWDKPIPNLPANVKLVSWVPQQDLLGHPNLRVFLTHGGLGSLVEAIYHKAVIVGVPLFFDQKPNIARAARKGFASSLDWDNLTTEDMVTSIKKAMQDQEMKAKMEETHRLFVDREKSPREKAAWWVEYVVRHGGVKFLKDGAEDVPWYQYHHVDVVIFLLIILLISILATALCCKYLYRFFSSIWFISSFELILGNNLFYPQNTEEHKILRNTKD